MGVFTRAGHIALTLHFLGAISADRAFAKAISAAFEAEYADIAGWGKNALVEDMKTSDAPLLNFLFFSRNRVSFICAVQFKFMVFSISLSSENFRSDE